MSKRDDLKRKLKASDRRRNRRSATTNATTTAAASAATRPPKVDVAGLVATTILEYVESSGAEVVDAAVVSALKGSLKATVPSGQHSRQLWARLDRLTHQEQVEIKAFRNAVNQMLETASSHQDPKNAHAVPRTTSHWSRSEACSVRGPVGVWNLETITHRSAAFATAATRYGRCLRGRSAGRCAHRSSRVGPAAGWRADGPGDSRRSSTTRC